MNPFRRAAAVALFFAASFATAAKAQWYQGPSGAPGGDAFDGWVLNNHQTNIRQILILSARNGNGLQCIVVEYPTIPNNPNSGFAGSAGPHNCNVASNADASATLTLDPDEYVLGISGTYTDHISSLRFYTNKKNSPLYGNGAGGVTFGYTAPRGQAIVAFTQSNDTRLRSIGVMYAPCDPKLKACK